MPNTLPRAFDQLQGPLVEMNVQQQVRATYSGPGF